MEKKRSWVKKFDSEAKSIQPAPLTEILRYAQRRDYILLGLGVVLAMVNGAITPFGSVIFRELSNTLIASQASFENGTFDVEAYTDSMLPYAYSYALLASLIFLTGFTSMSCLLTLSERQAYEIRKRYFAALLRQEMAWYDKKEAGALTNKLSTGVDRIKNGIGDKFGVLLQALTHLVSGFIIGFYYKTSVDVNVCNTRKLNPFLISSCKLALFTLIATPLIVLSLFGSIKMLVIMTRREMLAYDEASAVANEVISNIRTVTSFNAQYAEIARLNNFGYGDRLKYAQKMGIKGVLITGIFTGLYTFVIFGSMGFVFWYGTRLVLEGEITPGTVFAVFWGIMVGAIRFGQAVPYLGIFTAAKLAAGEIFQIIDLEPKIDCMSPHGLTPSHVEGRIEFQNIHFYYPARPSAQVLNGISLTVNPGSAIALVGHSGSGKSTLIGLLLRFYEQQSGRVSLISIKLKKILYIKQYTIHLFFLFFSKNLFGTFDPTRELFFSDLNIEWLRSKIGLVSQEPVIFAATVEENLKMGNETLTENEMIEACKIANAHDFVMKLPKVSFSSF
uniref:ABC transmembrane type-1 domain-containing protein n=1 Tax=Elaeophora elaphi TaxID=1147741 RepID=A0A0R3RPT0_9BILA